MLDKTVKKIALLAGVSLIAFNACKKGNKADCDFSREMQQLQELEDTYKSNPTEEQCQASKEFMLKLLNQAEDCPQANKQEIERIRQLIATEGCSALISE